MTDPETPGVTVPPADISSASLEGVSSTNDALDGVSSSSATEERDFEAEFRTPWPETLKRMGRMLLGRPNWELGEAVQVTVGNPAAKDGYWREKLGGRVEAASAGQLVPAPSHSRREFPRWSFCCTLFDVVDREFCAPPRIHMHTPWRFITIAIGPHGRMAGRLHSTSHWYKGWITLGRYEHQLCRNITALQYHGPYLAGYRICPLKKQHRGGCLDWKQQTRVHAATIDQLD